MLKYCGKQIFTHGRFPEVGQKQKTEREKKRKKKKERLNDGNNNDQLRIANDTSGDAPKPPGPIKQIRLSLFYVWLKLKGNAIFLNR